eukprot:5906387-Amphidinium_carterae.1
MERGRASKTHHFDESVVVDNPEFKWFEQILAALKPLAVNKPVFALSVGAWAKNFTSAPIASRVTRRSVSGVSSNCKHEGAGKRCPVCRDMPKRAVSLGLRRDSARHRQAFACSLSQLGRMGDRLNRSFALDLFAGSNILQKSWERVKMKVTLLAVDVQWHHTPDLLQRRSQNQTLEWLRQGRTEAVHMSPPAGTWLPSRMRCLRDAERPWRSEVKGADLLRIQAASALARFVKRVVHS